MPTLDRETRQLLNAARLLGSQGIAVFLEDHELLRLCAFVAADLNQRQLVSQTLLEGLSSNDYYGVPLEWFQGPLPPDADLIHTFFQLKQAIEDFTAYFLALCELHKRRLKFKLILERQTFPRLEQIAPRCLLEYGLRPAETLASWLVWRKWLYDIDNRAAQETGYLFEPILASAIGGVPCAAAKSPVKRAGNPLKGRQIDCIDERRAYEFKMRVTPAASGQGRFQEEMDFARDCAQSGYIPILLVLDPTPSTRLDSLTAEYGKYGGQAYTGDQAWEHIEGRAGRVMGSFVEKYIRVPLQEIDRAYTSLQPIRFVSETDRLLIGAGKNTFAISRLKAEKSAEIAVESDLTNG